MKKLVIAVMLGILVIGAIGFSGISKVSAAAPSTFTFCHVRTIDGMPVREQTRTLPFQNVIGDKGHFIAVDGIPNIGHELDYWGECTAKYISTTK